MEKSDFEKLKRLCQKRYELGVKMRDQFLKECGIEEDSCYLGSGDVEEIFMTGTSSHNYKDIKDLKEKLNNGHFGRQMYGNICYTKSENKE